MDVPALVCFDLPCLVDIPSGTADEALDRALRCLGLDADSPNYAAALSAGLRWPGREAHDLLRRVLGSDVWAEAAAAAYDDAFGTCAARGPAQVAAGAREVVSSLRAAGARICLTTEFSAATREALLDVLDWSDLVATLVSHGPFDLETQDGLVEAATARLAVPALDTAVVSDTCSGVAAGRRAGAGWVVGVLGSGAAEDDLRAAGATSVARLADLAPRSLPARLLPA